MARPFMFKFHLTLLLVSSSLLECHTLSIHGLTTESPETVQQFDPKTWMSVGAASQQIRVMSLKVETKVKLRYARTRINVNLQNPHDKPLQASFVIHIPDDALFSIFKLKRANEPKLYTAKVVKKEDAREIFHFAHVKTNGTMSAGLIELINDNSLSSYNLKFTLGPGMRLQGFLVFESQLERNAGTYSSKFHIIPLQIPFVEFFEVSVDIEELENIRELGCSEYTESIYANCSSTLRHSPEKPNQANLVFQKMNVTSGFLKDRPFEFVYELEQRNTTSAVVIAQSNGNIYFLHLFVPENLPVVRKHVVFLLDISDSMYGTKLEQLKWGMLEIVDDLSRDDFFSIITFSTEASIWTKYVGERKNCPVPFEAKRENREEIADYINNSLSAHGATNIYAGLSTAFDIIDLFSPHTNDTCKEKILTLNLRSRVKTKLPENVESVIFFLSDGKATFGPSNSSVLLEWFRKLNHRETRQTVPIHTIALGEDADIPFLRALSFQNKGVTKIISNESAAGVELEAFYLEISSTVLPDIQNYYSMPGKTKESFSVPLLVYRGKEILTVGKLFPESNHSDLLDSSLSNFTWTTGGMGRSGRLQYESSVYDCRSIRDTMAQCVDKIDYLVIRLQAYQMLKKLLHRDELVRDNLLCPKSYDDEELFSARIRDNDYEYEDYDSDEACVNPFKAKIIELAMKYNFVTPYTAWILQTEAHVDPGLLSSNKSEPSRRVDLDEVPRRGGANNDAEHLQKFVVKSTFIDHKLGHSYKTAPPTTLRKHVKEERVNADNSTSQDNLIMSAPPFHQWLSSSVEQFFHSLFNKVFGNEGRIDVNKSNDSLASNHSLSTRHTERFGEFDFM